MIQKYSLKQIILIISIIYFSVFSICAQDWSRGIEMELAEDKSGAIQFIVIG